MKIFINGKRCQSATLAQVAKMLNELADGGHTLVADEVAHNLGQAFLLGRGCLAVKEYSAHLLTCCTR